MNNRKLVYLTAVGIAVFLVFGSFTGWEYSRPEGLTTDAVMIVRAIFMSTLVIVLAIGGRPNADD